MKICLINLPSPDLAEPWSNFPLGLGYLAAAMEDRGLHVTVWDLCSKALPKNAARIPAADIYGISVTSPQYDSAMSLAGWIREAKPQSIIVAGGPHPTVCRESMSKRFDSVVVGEGELSLWELVKHYQIYGRIKPVYGNLPISDLDKIPFPARHLFADFKQNALKSRQLLKREYAPGGTTTVIASRGCPFQCSFCAPHSRRMRFRSPQNVVDELAEIIDFYGIRQFKWQDDTFTVSREWVLETCALIKEQLPATFHRAHTRVDTFDEKMAGAMAQAGFKLLCFGVESFSQELLDLNLKAVTVAQVEKALKIAKKHGFETLAYLIFGLPGETPDTVAETKAGVLRNKKHLDHIVLSTLVPFAGSPLVNDPDRFNCEILETDLSKHWLFGHEVKDHLFVKTKGVSLAAMVAAKREFYDFIRMQGYARPEWKKGDLN